MAHLGLLYGAQIGFILSNKVIYALFFSSLGIGRFCGRIFLGLLINPVGDLSPSLLRRESLGLLAGPSARARECPRHFHEALRESFPAQVIREASHTPPPPRGLGWRKGGDIQEGPYCPSVGVRLLQKFSGNLDFRPEKFGRTNFRPENFPVFQLSNRKKSGPKTFATKKSGRTNFQTQNFWPEKLSNRMSGT